MQKQGHWKDRYQDLWGTANEREELVKQLLEDYGYDVEYFGFGAGDDGYIKAQPEAHGYEKGDPDLKITDRSVFIEVTGTDVASVRPEYDIWIRPDKLENALNHPERMNWVVHVLNHEELIRGIYLTEKRCEHLLEDGKRVKKRTQQMAKEEFIAIDPSKDCVREIDGVLVEMRDAIVDWL